MDFETFHKIVEKRQREQPILFALGHDRSLSPDEIELYEKGSGITIPEKYRLFLLHYGGGYFGFASAYSFDCKSTFFILNHLEDVPAGYLPFSENGCGDLFLLKVEEGACHEQVYVLDHETKKIKGTGYPDVFDYLAQVGLSVTV